MFRAFVVGGLLAGFVLLVGYFARGGGLDGPCISRLDEPPLPEGSSVSSELAAWPPGAVKCVTEFPSGRIRMETFPRDGYWVAATALGLVPLALWALLFRSTSPAEWTRPWQRKGLAAARVALTLVAAGFAAFALLFFILVWIIPPLGPICAGLAWLFWQWAKDLRGPILTSDASRRAS